MNKSLLVLFALTYTSVCLGTDKLRSVQAKPAISYPVRLAYIDRINSFQTVQSIAAGMGIPGYAPANIYNYICLGYWTSSKGAQDIAEVWAEPLLYYNTTSPFGKTKEEIQKNIKKIYNDKGIKIFVSVFGPTEVPTTHALNATNLAIRLADFVSNNNLDGIDIDWEDSKALDSGYGQAWLIEFQRKIRELLPQHLISHAPQAAYFKKQKYKNGGYVTVHQTVGALIDFYNVKFYNQGDSQYNSYNSLFIKSEGSLTLTSVNELVQRGIPSKMIIIGKPVKVTDAINTGWMDTNQLGQAVSQGYSNYKWFGGVAFWEFISDPQGTEITKAAGHLRELCSTNKDCK